MKFIKVAIGAVIAMSVIPVVVTTVNDLTGSGGDLNGTPAGTLLALAPLVFVAGVLTFIIINALDRQSD